MTKLHELFKQQGQSPWLDNLKRGFLTTGELAQLVEQGVRGVTSNPTIFQKAIADSEDYDDQFKTLLEGEKASIEDAYWSMVIDDINAALEVLRPVYDESEGRDGYVSLELAPSLANDTDGSIAAARDFHERIRQPNLFVKIPATEEGVPAIHQMISEGRSINITLIFSLDRYETVIEAYLSGLEAYDGDPSEVASVASFFVSRVDTEVDRRLEAVGSEEALALRGKAAVAQAKLAYRIFKEQFSGPRWEALEARGARAQRPLWASTSTKNPDYPDLLYVDQLIGDNTVNTMPDKTIESFLDHGTVARTIDKGVDEAKATLDRLADFGIDMADVSHTLEDEGAVAFTKSFDELIQSLTDKADSIT
ncbi:MAG: transaldolase [Actinobacteria bacterium]|nr:transaldolase [Actinomycetota bacterium]